MSVSPTSKTLNIGETVQLTGTKNPTSASEGTQWTSSNTGVATVSGSGLVTAKATGTATITFKNSSSTKSATCKIVVNDPTISIVESYVSYYADINDDGIVDGIIYADLLHGHSGTFGSNSSGNYTIPTISNPKQSVTVSTVRLGLLLRQKFGAPISMYRLHPMNGAKNLKSACR